MLAAPAARGQKRRMIIAAELPWAAPEHAFLALTGRGVAFLDSSAPGDFLRAGVSYLCLAPEATLALDENPYASLRDWMAEQRPAQTPNWPFPFKGGAVGWLGYDAARAAAGVMSRFAPLPGLPGGWFGLYTTLLGFDHARQRLHYLGPAERLASIISQLAAPPAPPVLPPFAWGAEMDRETYVARHEQLRAYIAAGDVYQANFTLRFCSPRPPAATMPALHMALRRLSPAPFAACIDAGGFGLVSASPERFIRLHADGQVETRPIKGTIARHADPGTDTAAAAALAASPKERAENLMITDLLRHDLGQVCAIGSIAVPELFAVESYAQAHHLVSAVTGQLRPGLDAFDLLAATLPGGSITGAPKRRAMQIIDELELGPRGAYCGALAWIGFDGAMDSAIIIRTVTASADRLYAQAGGGITWDSSAPAEYEEAMLKISPLLALGDG
jgi:para-aminobenzoate synthetase component 1